MEHKQSDLALPFSVATRSDVARLLRELEAVDNYLKQMEIRSKQPATALPKMSRLLDEVCIQNKLNLLEAKDRIGLIDFLETIRTKAPILHMSFTSDLSPTVTAKLMTWLRQEVHPHVLLQAGLQPNMGAGCVVRTTNKYFDFSLRKRLSGEKDKLLQAMRGLPSKKVEEPVTVKTGAA